MCGGDLARIFNADARNLPSNTEEEALHHGLGLCGRCWYVQTKKTIDRLVRIDDAEIYYGIVRQMGEKL